MASGTEARLDFKTITRKTMAAGRKTFRFVPKELSLLPLMNAEILTEIKLAISLMLSLGCFCLQFSMYSGLPCIFINHHCYSNFAFLPFSRPYHIQVTSEFNSEVPLRSGKIIRANLHRQILLGFLCNLSSISVFSLY